MAQTGRRFANVPNHLDRRSALPLYVQLKQSLREQIERGRWKPGDLVPPEPELCLRFGVSRTVVRQALSDLTLEGLIVRQRGRGTFVAPPKLTESAVQRLSGFYEDMQLLGHPPVSQVLKQGIVPASERVAIPLQLKAGARVIEIERLRFVDEEPLVLTTTYLPLELCPSLVNADLTRRSLYEYLESECGLALARGRRTIEAVAADEREAHLLRVRKGAPLILLYSVSYLPDGRPVEYYLALHRADRSRFEVELVRQAASAASQVTGPLPRGSGELIGSG